MATLQELCMWSLMSVKYRLGGGVAVDEQSSNDHQFYATFNFKKLDLKIKWLNGWCCFGCCLTQTRRLLLYSKAYLRLLLKKIL